MQNTQKAALLRRAVTLLEQADVLQQQAIGAETDSAYYVHTQIQNVIDDLRADIVELDVAE